MDKTRYECKSLVFATVTLTFMSYSSARISITITDFDPFQNCFTQMNLEQWKRRPIQINPSSLFYCWQLFYELITENRALVYCTYQWKCRVGKCKLTCPAVIKILLHTPPYVTSYLNYK